MVPRGDHRLNEPVVGEVGGRGGGGPCPLHPETPPFSKRVFQAHALLQHAGKWLEERLRVIKQAAQAEGFITVPAARDRQRQAQQTTTLAEKWRVAHALAAETGDRTDDLDKDHTMNRRRIWELVKGKNNRHDRDPRTKQ